MQCENEINQTILKWKTNRGRGKRDLTIAPPFSPTNKPYRMKIQKYIFLLPNAVDRVSNRFDVPVFSLTYLFILYSVQYMPFDCTQQGIIRHAKRMKYPIAASTISEALTLYKQIGFVDHVEGRYSLAPRGREYLSAIRRFLLNQRL